jgi:hypothetical protein
MSLHPLERLYSEYIEASDKVMRDNSLARARVSQIEGDICTILSHQPGGIIVGNVHFVRIVVEIGDQRLTYFKATMITPATLRGDEKTASAGGFATHWGRRIGDVLPVAAPEKPSLRRKRVA